MTYGNGGGIPTTQGGYSAAAQTQTPLGAITIPTVLDAQAKAVGELHDLIGQLEGRLNVVLGPEQPATETASAPTPNPIHVLDRVQDHTRGVNLAMSRLHRLMQRLQL